MKGRCHRKCWTSENCTKMFGYVQIVEWPSTKAQAATKWCALVVVSYFAFVAARQSMAMITSSRSSHLLHQISLPLWGNASMIFVLLTYVHVRLKTLKSVWFRNCRLFEAADMTDWDKQMIELQNGIQMRAQKQPLGGTIRCPKCREKNFKVTRHIFWI